MRFFVRSFACVCVSWWCVYFLFLYLYFMVYFFRLSSPFSFYIYIKEYKRFYIPTTIKFFSLFIISYSCLMLFLFYFFIFSLMFLFFSSDNFSIKHMRIYKHNKIEGTWFDSLFYSSAFKRNDLLFLLLRFFSRRIFLVWF